MLTAALGSLLLIAGRRYRSTETECLSRSSSEHRRRPEVSQQAYEKIVAAQEANEFDMQGHAQKAKNLLDQVNNELKQAAEAANKNK